MDTNKMIPTTEEYFKFFSDLYQFEEGDPEYLVDKEDFKTVLIAFAKLHVEAALLAAENEATLDTINMGSSEFQTVVDKESIRNAYPLTNIK